MQAPDTYQNIYARLLKREPFPNSRAASSLVNLTSDLDLNPGLKAKLTGRKFKPAAVLIPLQIFGDDIKILLTKRSEDLPDHPGQISFPGGTRERGESAKTTALRESREEIGLPESHVHILGEMPRYQVATGFEVTPVIGLIENDFKIILDEREVSEVFYVPLDFLINPDNHKKHSREFMGQPRFFHAIPYEGYYIWGATAAIIVNFSVLLLDYAAG